MNVSLLKKSTSWTLKSRRLEALPQGQWCLSGGRDLRGKAHRSSRYGRRVKGD